MHNARSEQRASRSSGVPLRPRQQPPLASPPEQPRCPVLGQVQDLPSSTTRNGTGQDLRWPPQHTLSLCVSSAQVHEQEARRGLLPLASKPHGCDTEAAAHGRATIGANRRICGAALATPYRFWAWALHNCNETEDEDEDADGDDDDDGGNDNGRRR